MSQTPTPSGGSFLIDNPQQTFTPEDFTPEHLAIARATDEFWKHEAAPNIEAIQHQDFDVLLRVLRKSAELGLVATLVPEKFGGMEMDLASAMIVTEGVARDASYAVCHGGQAGIGALPVLLFGTEQQKQKYLPRLASAEMVAAYCLTEAQAGSDALAARTTAVLSADQTHYLLNGQKVWITNGGIADLYTVFAQVPAEDPSQRPQFTAFLVERIWPGVSSGAEEKKMGLKGSSTTSVYFDNVKVPAENVLGEVGRGHLPAFNILNIGRLKLAAFAQGECKEVLAHSIRYARERRAFGKSISEFGLIQHKLAEMTIRMFVNESMVYRVTGLIQDRLSDFTWDLPDAGQVFMKAVQEFAMECSLVKVFGSEVLGYVTDEAVQIHGGYGYHQDYAVERAYRDARIYRIFEGTNEINRLVATSMLLKPAKETRRSRFADVIEQADTVPTTDLLSNAKKVALLLLRVAGAKLGGKLEDHQEIAAAFTDILIQIFAMESATLRAAKAKREQMWIITGVFTDDALGAIETRARMVLAACCEDEVELKRHLDAVHRLVDRPVLDTIALRRQIAERVLEAGRYMV
ncbi:MAG: acyl-CoA dehydrogenase family protein [Acidobacteriota bacterium]